MLWWLDIFCIDAAFGVVEKKLEDAKNKQQPKLPRARNFEELAGAE